MTLTSFKQSVTNNSNRFQSMLVGNTAYTTAFESIATVTATSGATSLSFNNIPSTYSHLQIRGIYRDTGGAAVVANMIIQFNSDTSANYSWHRIESTNATSVTSSGATSQTYGLCAAFGGQNATTANTFGAGIINIMDYSLNTKYKTIFNMGGIDNNTTGTVAPSSGLWLNTGIITSITIKPGNVGFALGTTFALYGIKGA